MQKESLKKIIVLGVCATALGIAGGLAKRSESASLTSVSVTLSNSRPSFRGALAAGNSEGASQVIIDTSSYPSTTTDQLQSNDSVSIGSGGSLGSYTITGVTSGSQFTVTPVLGSGHADAGDDVISTVSAELAVRFTTANAIANGRFRVLVPSLASDTAAADGIPDQGEFDFGSSAPTVTCPNDTSGYDFVAGTATASAITIGSQEYHAYECAYSGSGAIGTAFNSTNNMIVIDSVINPAPASGHVTGTADSERIIVQHINDSFAVADSTTTAVGIIEAVRVTASVAPQITFSIAGISSGATACNVSTDVTTTAAAVPLGELSISAFTDAAQRLTVSTNATNGYVVTARASDQLGLDAQTCTGDPTTDPNCIPDSRGDNAAMSHTASDEWALTATKGFAYSIDNNDAATPAFEYTTATGNCSGTYCARQFADTEQSEAAQTLFSSSTVADSEDVDVCYRAVISNTQAAGNYENYVIYTATATF